MTPADLYNTYRHALTQVSPPDKFMPYNWARLPSTISAIWLPYCQMLEDYARELANPTNALTNDLHRLSAWAQVIPTLSDEQKMEAGHEFVDALATHALLLPYVIKSRFAFAVAHLSHQANRAVNETWIDKFPSDREITFKTPDKYGRNWKAYSQFKVAFDAIHDSEFRNETGDFRHVHSHRFSPRIVIGLTGAVTRMLDKSSGRVSYLFGGQRPLELTSIVGLLIRERDRCAIAFEHFQRLVGEQLTAIVNHPTQKNLVR